MWYKKEYGIDLPKDKYYGVDYQWSEQELEMADKYQNGECLEDFDGIHFLDYVRDYNDKILEKYSNSKYNNLTKGKLDEIIETLRKLFEEGILKQINHILFGLVIDYNSPYAKKQKLLRTTNGIRFAAYRRLGLYKTPVGLRPLWCFVPPHFCSCWNCFAIPLSQLQKRRIPRTLDEMCPKMV
jgi:hypothetical protein